MVYGYVLISTKNTYEHRVAEELLDLEEVVDVEHLLVEETAMADPFFKDYDLIAKIKVNNSKDLRKIVEDKILTVEGVEKTTVGTKPKL